MPWVAKQQEISHVEDSDVFLTIGVSVASLIFASVFEGWLCARLRASSNREPRNFGGLAFSLTSALTLPVGILLWVAGDLGLALTIPFSLALYFGLHELLYWNHANPPHDCRPRWILRLPLVKPLALWYEGRQMVREIDPDKNFNTLLPIYDLIARRYCTRPTFVPAAFRYRPDRLDRSQLRVVRFHEDDALADAA
ncbi:MAG TPA: hypothetical protein VM328_05725 [Fimbriimonadaceae bacterium]|nr:hypothetical protein [Fimbriimonadaceae bacterium]